MFWLKKILRFSDDLNARISTSSDKQKLEHDLKYIAMVKEWGIRKADGTYVDDAHLARLVIGAIPCLHDNSFDFSRLDLLANDHNLDVSNVRESLVSGRKIKDLLDGFKL